MPERIRVADYVKQPLEEIEFPDGAVWKLRQPLEQDYYRRQQVVEEHVKRVQERARQIAERARAKAEESGDDAEARAVIDEEADEEALDVEFTLRYLHASVLAIFIEPNQEPKTILEKLPPDLMHYLLARIDEVLAGDAAKKRLRSESR